MAINVSRLISYRINTNLSTSIYTRSVQLENILLSQTASTALETRVLQQQSALFLSTAYATRDTLTACARHTFKNSTGSGACTACTDNLLHHWAEPLALRAWRERTRVVGAVWRAHQVLQTQSLQQTALFSAAVCVRQGSMG